MFDWSALELSGEVDSLKGRLEDTMRSHIWLESIHAHPFQQPIFFQNLIIQDGDLEEGCGKTSMKP